MILVLLPFWTSLLVRTTAWMVLLQQQGVINDVLVWPRHHRRRRPPRDDVQPTGTVIAMTHILLPFMVLPLYSVMSTIKPSYVRAAHSLGATAWTAFRRVYLPQTLPGVGAGALLVFILASATTSPRRWSAAPPAAHLEPDRLPHPELAQLVARGRAGDAAARRGAGALLALRPAGRHRQHEARVSPWPLPVYASPASAPGTTPTARSAR